MQGLLLLSFLYHLSLGVLASIDCPVGGVFVHNAGNITNGNGTLESPYESIPQALEALHAANTKEGTICLLSGTYTDLLSAFPFDSLVITAADSDNKAVLGGTYSLLNATKLQLTQLVARSLTLQLNAVDVQIVYSDLDGLKLTKSQNLRLAGSILRGPLTLQSIGATLIANTITDISSAVNTLIFIEQANYLDISGNQFFDNTFQSTDKSKLLLVDWSPFLNFTTVVYYQFNYFSCNFGVINGVKEPVLLLSGSALTSELHLANNTVNDTCPTCPAGSEPVDVLSCKVCPAGTSSPEGRKCVTSPSACTFWQEGEDCSKFSKNGIIVVACAGGGLLLIVVIAIILFVKCRGDYTPIENA